MYSRYKATMQSSSYSLSTFGINLFYWVIQSLAVVGDLFKLKKWHRGSTSNELSTSSGAELVESI